MRRSLIVATTLIAACAFAHADTYPSKPIRAIIPAGAGSAVDVVPRIVFDELSRRLGQPIIVENRAGAGTVIGTTAVAKAEPDGYTLLANSTAQAITPAMYDNLTYDTVNDFQAIGAIGSLPNVLVIAPSKNLTTLPALVAAAKQKPGSFNFVSLGGGSAVHMSAERFRVAAGYEAQAIPFKGGSEALTEVMTGRVDYYFCPIATALPFIRDGKLLGLGVSSVKRSSLLPDVPTTLELGFADSDFTFWLGVFVPAKTPKEIVDKLNTEMAAAIASPAVKEKLAGIGVEAMTMTPSEFQTYVKGEVARYDAFVKKVGIKAN